MVRHATLTWITICLVGSFSDATEPVNIGSQLELLVDDLLIDKLVNARLELHRPQPAEIAIQADRPWEGGFNHGGTVIFDGNQYHMYYRAWPSPGTYEENSEAFVCCAVSPDGVHWKKPELGLVTFEGSKANNILADFDGQPIRPSFDVFLDERPGVPLDQRFKAFSYSIGGQRKRHNWAGRGTTKDTVRAVVGWVSTDGFRWRKMDPQPQLTSTLSNTFDSRNYPFWSAAEDCYVFYFRYMIGRHQRSVLRSTSKDLINWSPVVPMTYSDTDSDVPAFHVYTNMTKPYFRAPHIYISLGKKLVKGRRVFNEEEMKELDPFVAKWLNKAPDCSDVRLMSTRPGSDRYQVFQEAFLRPGPGANNWVSRTNDPLAGIFPTGDHQLSMYVGRHYGQPSWHVRRYTLRVDGFVSVNAPYAGGELITKPLVFTGEHLAINYATSAAGSVRVEIQDEDGRPVEGYGLDDSREIIGDEIERFVEWKGNAKVGNLAGEVIRLRFALKDADLYSFQFRTER